MTDWKEEERENAPRSSTMMARPTILHDMVGGLKKQRLVGRHLVEHHFLNGRLATPNYEKLLEKEGKKKAEIELRLEYRARRFVILVKMFVTCGQWYLITGNA